LSDTTVFLTGANGFLGTWVARELVARPDCAVLALVRARDQATAEQRLRRIWWDWPELERAIGSRVQVLCGDVSRPRLGLSDVDYTTVVRQTTHIIHTAAELRLDAPVSELRPSNVEGAAHILDLARDVQRDHGLSRLGHVSTAYVAGGRCGPVPEDALTDAYGFSSSYELSKYEGERLVQAARDELPISVFRPGMVVGDSQTGSIHTFNTFYFPVRLYLAQGWWILPARRDLPVNIVPVDYVAQAIVRLTFHPEAEGLTFHLTAPTESLPRVGELADFIHDWAREHLGLRLPRPLLLPLSIPRGRYRADQPTPRKSSTLADLRTLLPYFTERADFRRDNVDRLLGPYPLRWQDFLPHLLDFAVYRGFLHRSERTVHEQIIFRLARSSRPIRYYDIVEGQTIPRSAAAVRQEMLAAAVALRALGVQPGDRVAIVGLNSTRYLALDVAIGLVGAVSVPLYYTSPPAEVDLILRASGARLLLIGAPGILARLGELQTKVPVVSFCRENGLSGLPPSVMPWDEFLALGANQQDFSPAPVGLGEMATLRYTSGTTGRPKGVIFHHAHLRWMGECIASLLPWQARNKRGTWLSCLPMSHVVEGILATYAPYYLPTSVDIYFLENLRELPQTLRCVRPTAFFSVPRVYEKVWEAFSQSSLGRRYLGLSDGLARRALRPLVRRGILKKAGFDRCVQLIVGSAPVSEDLLRSFREVGIEIHNAYGLTEAPLVTINRVGRNRLGTVGEPLPNTEVRISDTGEVLVRGPQVTAGYYGEQPDTLFCDGWLLTGDLGYLTAEGSLVIQGRAKELLKTSYGKYVHPCKVEGLLRELPGVVEGMLLGEGRPYCVALLWVDENHRDTTAAAQIAHAIAQVNTRLSHPEQVKRWAILPASLSTEGGELTANLKLKRQVVTTRFQAVLDALYEGTPPPAEALHVGQAERDS